MRMDFSAKSLILLFFALLFVFGVPHGSGDPSGWRIELSFPAHALTSGCEMPGDGDTDGDECDPNYLNKLDLLKNLGRNNSETNKLPTCCGNPVDYATGNKIEDETDYVGAGGFPLVLVRHYNSLDPATSPQSFGIKQRAPYSRSIAMPSAGVAKVTRDNGAVFSFTLINGAWKGDADVNSRLSQTASGWTYVTALDETETYDANGRLLAFANRSGLTQTVSYDAQGRLSIVKDPFDRALTFTYQSASSPLVVKVTDPAGRSYSYAYDARNNLVSASHPDGGIRRYVYENASFPNHLTGVVDELGVRYATFTYDASGLAVSTEHAGGVEKFTFDYSNRQNGVVVITNALGGQFSMILQAVNGTAQRRYLLRGCPGCLSPTDGVNDNPEMMVGDANGNVTSYAPPFGARTVYTYDLTRNLELSRSQMKGYPQERTINTTWHSAFRLPMSISGSGRTADFTYDAKGNLLTKTVAQGATSSQWSYSYNQNGQVLSATDPLGHITSYGYDAKGNLLSVSNALGQATSILSYDSDGRPLIIKKPNGLVVTLAYNFRGQIASRADGALTTSYVYDLAGQITRVTSPDGSTRDFAYDAAHRLIRVMDGVGNQTVYSLDAMGNRIQIALYDQSQNLKQFHNYSYDKLGRLEKDIGAQAQTTTFKYDDNDNVTSVTDPVLFQYSASYDGFSQIQSIIADFETSNYTYDKFGRLITVTDRANRQVTNYAFDLFDSPITTVGLDSGSLTKTYDGVGNIISSIDARGAQATYTYDVLNRRVSETMSDGKVITYGYDEGPVDNTGRLSSMADNAGKTLWLYDGNGRLLEKNQQMGVIALSTRHSYDAVTGRRTSTTLPSGATIRYSYDAIGHISEMDYKLSGSSVESALLSKISYSPSGNVVAWLNGNGGRYTRSFDQDGRIVSINFSNNNSQSITYDANSRIVSLTEGSIADKGFQYSSPNFLSYYTYGIGYHAKRYGYEPYGNIVSLIEMMSQYFSSTSVSFIYSQANNILQSITSGSSITGAILHEDFTNDASGNRLTDNSPGGNYSFSYDARGRMSQAMSGALTTNYVVNGLGQRVLKSNPANANDRTYFVYDEAGHLQGEYDAAGRVIQETVWLGDLPVATLQPMGAFWIQPDYLGAPHQIVNALGQVAWFWDHDPYGNGAPTGGLAYNLRLPGQYYDKETGLHYNGFRDYDPRIGRYIEPDPIGFAGGINPYLYVNGNPMNSIDPYGLTESRSNHWRANRWMGRSICWGNYW